MAVRVPWIPYVQGINAYRDVDGVKYGIAIHNTSNDASDEGEASYATRRTDGISSHFYCDRDSVTQSLDTEDIAGHAGSSEGNNHSIAVEITGGNGKPPQWWLENVAWDELGRVLAWVIKNDPDYAGFEVRRASIAEMTANPRVKAFYGHNDMRRAWGGTTHTDPGPNFPWERLFEAVNHHLNGDDMSWTEELANDVWPDRERASGSRMSARDRLVQTQGRTGQILKELAGLRAMLAAVGGRNLDEVRAELDRHRGLLVEELAERLSPALVAELGPALTQTLGEAADQVPAAVIEGAVTRAVARIQLAVPSPGG